jgi:hypothetical protein
MHTAKIIYWRTLGLPKAILTRVKRFLLPDGQGDWIFDVKVISWAFAPSLRRQLPWTHRLFVAYGYFIRHLKYYFIMTDIQSISTHLTLGCGRYPTNYQIRSWMHSNFDTFSDPEILLLMSERTMGVFLLLPHISSGRPEKSYQSNPNQHLHGSSSFH